jgi:RNA polymerase sigma-70 factor (ECF subfamily)
MAVARPERPANDAAPREPTAGAEADADRPVATRGSASKPRAERPSPGGSAPPAPRPPAVNSPVSPASNTKEARAREAVEDRALIVKAQSGDHAAFRALVERHQRRAFSVAFALVRDENDARELVQDAFLRVFKSLDSFEGTSSFFTWLYRIITNLSIDLIRKPSRQVAPLDENQADREDADSPLFPLVSRIDGADPADAVRRREIGARLQTALDALPPYHRSVIVMREVEGLSYEEMATASGVSKGTIMSRLFHARQKLQRALADCYAEQVGHGAGTPEGQRVEGEQAPGDGEEPS